MFALEIRLAAERALRAELPAIASALWKAFSAGHVTETEATELSALIEARTVVAEDKREAPREGDAVSLAATAPVRRHGSRPRTDASLERRRRWAASGRLPPALAARFTLAEQAVLALVAAETGKRGDCRLAVPHLAAVVGVSETTVRNAIREAAKLGLVTVEARRLTGFRNDTNIVRIIAPEWTAWLRLARKTLHDTIRGGGCKSPHRMHTQVLEQGKTKPGRPRNRPPAKLKAPRREQLRDAGA